MRTVGNAVEGSLQRQLGAVQPHEAFVKVPEITIAFWVIKILTTGMGETTSDFFVRSFDPPPVVAAAGVVLAISLGAQILSRRYSTWLYWLTVVLVSIFGHQTSGRFVCRLDRREPGSGRSQLGHWLGEPRNRNRGCPHHWLVAAVDKGT